MNEYLCGACANGCTNASPSPDRYNSKDQFYTDTYPRLTPSSREQSPASAQGKQNLRSGTPNWGDNWSFHMEECLCVLCREREERVFTNLQRGMVLLYPLEKVGDDVRVMMSYFLASHAVPAELWQQLDKSFEVSVSITHKTSLEVSWEKLEIAFQDKGGASATLRFAGAFYMSTFITALCLNFTLVTTGNKTLAIESIEEARSKASAKPKFRKSLASHVHDLYAHQSLLEYLGYPLSEQDQMESMVPLASALILKLIESPQDSAVLGTVARSRVDPAYALLVILILASDCSFRTAADRYVRPEPVVIDGDPVEIANPVYLIDALTLGGSSSINSDYHRLKLQWSTMTERQFSHMENMHIILKLLENTTLTSFASGHPLTRVVFDVMASTFTLKDELSTYHTELFYILMETAQLFHPIDKLAECELGDIEHVVFWLFIAIVTKSKVLSYFEHKNPERVLDHCIKVVRMLHPLLFDLLSSAGVNNFEFLAKLVLGLLTPVATGPKLWNIWISALASGDPMEFFQLMMASMLIISYPRIIGRDNIVEAVEKEIKSFIATSSADVLIGITWKLKDAAIRND